MSKYKVVVVGMGKRGKHHAAAFQANDAFEVVGICDINEETLAEAAATLGNPKTSTDAAAPNKSSSQANNPRYNCFLKHS